jgi:hypothetical protein
MDNVETIIVTDILREFRQISMYLERIADAQEKLVILLTKPDEDSALTEQR